MKSREGVLLFAHGARDPAWARPFEAVAAQLRTARPDRPLALAFLELMAPDMGTAAEQLISGGCEAVTIVPLFLGAGRHVKRDLPRLVDELRTRHPTTRFRLAPAIGETESVIVAIATAAGSAAEVDWPSDTP